MEKNIKNVGYTTITYKMRLYTDHRDCLILTKEKYNEVILKYYNLLLENIEFLNLSNQYCLRELEKITIVSKDGRKPKNYIDMDIPVYFRRAAINHAIGSVRSYISNIRNFEENQKKKEILKTINQDDFNSILEYQKFKQKNNLEIKDIKEPQKSKSFSASPLYYKGMYKNLTNTSIELKLLNGENWIWSKASISGRKFDVEEAMSPTIVVTSKYAMIHLPVRKKIDDVTPVKERIHKETCNILSIAFSNTNNFAICIVMDKNGKFISSKFINGGDEYRDKTSRILSKIKKDRQTNKKLQEKDHKNYWDKLKKLYESTAHKVSKEIIDYAKEKDVQVIAISEQDEKNEFITKKVGRYSPIYLRHRIIEFIKYKAFKDSILITEQRSNYTASKCYKCRTKIVRKNVQDCVCEKGHNNNYYFNTAMNVGLMCLKKFGNIK